jgi:hypothetical protein
MRKIAARFIGTTPQSVLQIVLRFSVNGVPGEASHELGVRINLYSDYHLLDGKEGGARNCIHDKINMETGILSSTKR